MRTRITLILFGVCAALVACRALVAERPPINLTPPTPEQVLNHERVRSARLGPADADNGTVRLMPWRTEDDVVEGWDWSLPPGVRPVPNSGGLAA